MIACVAPSPAVDRLLELDGPVRVGRIHRPTGVVAVPGGKGLNVARVAAALGARVEAVAPLGGASGRWIAKRLAAEGVDVRRVATRAESRVCVSVAGNGEPLTEFYEPAAPVDPAEWRALERAVRLAGRSARWVTISGSLPPGAPEDGTARLVEIARSGGARVALDVAGLALQSAVEVEPDLVKVNAAEAASLLGDLPDVHALRRRAGGAGHAAAITHGSAGLELVDEDGVAHHAAPPVLGAYPVGSGDATLAALVVERAAGGSWAEAVALAAAAGAAAAELPGAGVLSSERVRALAAGVAVTADPGALRGEHAERCR